MSFKIFEDFDFQDKIKKYLNQKQIINFENIKDQISQKGFIGKPIKFNFFREKRIDKKRVYFLIYEEYKIVLFVGFSNKKYQQKEIDKLLIRFDEFKKIAKNLSNL